MPRSLILLIPGHPVTAKELARLKKSEAQWAFFFTGMKPVWTTGKYRRGGSQRVHGSLTDSALEIQTAAPNHQELPGSERRGEALLHPFRSTPTNATFLRMSDFTAVRMG